jgi:hypothetical protein
MLPELARRRRVQASRTGSELGARLLRRHVGRAGSLAGLRQRDPFRVVERLARPNMAGAVRLATSWPSIQSALCGGAGTLAVCGVHRRPTMRSSGPRGQAMVFPDVVSARGRLTRR